VSIEEFIRHLAEWSFVGELQGLWTKPLHAHDSDEAIGENALTDAPRVRFSSRVIAVSILRIPAA